MRSIYVLLLLLTTALSAVAQEKGSIVGVLIDKETNGQPLPFATVQLKNTTKGGTTDFDGLYEIQNVDLGTYTLVFSFVGYETLEIPNVTVEADKVTTVNAGLGASSATLDEVLITVTTSRESEVALLLEQKNAVSIQQSIGADELQRKAVSDAAAAIAKISGVSKQSGGGGNIYVRGLGDRYLNTTYNGLSLPSNDIENKNINLDLFPSDIIQNVDVSKAYSSQFYGDFAAGNINVVSKEFKGKAYFDIDLGTSINTNAVGQDKNLRSEGTGYFGFYNRYDNNPFAVILSHGPDAEDAGPPINLSGSASGGITFDLGNNTSLSAFAVASFNNYVGYREGSAADYTKLYNQRFDAVEWYDYNTTTTGMANITFRTGNTKINFNSLFLNSTSDEVSNFGIDGNGKNIDAFINQDAGFFVKNIQFQQDMIFVNQLSGTHQMDDGWTFDWGVGLNKAISRQPDRKRFSLENYNLALDDDPDTSPSFYNNNDFDNQRYFQMIQDEELNSRINLKYEVSDNIKFNFGHNGRYKQRFFENTRYGYDLIEARTPVPDVNNLNDIFTVENLGTVYNTSVINSIAPEIGIGINNNPGLPENTYTGRLNIHALYADAEFNFGKWLFVPGMRVEFFDQSINYSVINLANGNDGDVEAKDNFYLPNLNVRYALNDDQNLRLSLSKTVSFPEFKEVAPFVYENVVTRIGGNPDILTDPSFSDIHNLDIKYENFFGRGELVSLAAFAKQINDPINKVIANDATGTQRFFRTGGKATVYGVEIELRKNLIEDQNGQPNFAFGLNATYMYTNQDLRSSDGIFSSTLDRDDQLQGASPFLINADLNYSPTQFGNYKPVANLVYSYFYDRIDAIGAGQLGNIVEKGVHSLDFVFRNELGTNWEINFSAKNLLNPDISFTRENTSKGDIDITKFKFGVNLSLSAKYKF